ncbi:MAG: Fic family protein [Victivallales bacterium]|nr:Fic family protein [Victivallales bacterium]
MKPVFTITNKVADRLRQIDQARGFLAAAKLSEDWIAEMSRKALIREAHATTHIEGSQLSLEQAENLFAGKQAPGADPDDVRELLNYRKAFDLVADYVAGQEPITEGLIRDIHKRLVEGVRGGSAEPGTYRKVQNYVSQTGKAVYTPPPAHDVPILMREMVEWFNTETDTHPVLVSGIAQFQLVHIHPFIDGNGRTSRLLSTLCLYRTGYDFKHLFTISEYYDRDRLAFYKAIQGVRDSGMDMTGWLEFYTDGLSTQMQEVTDKGTRIIKRDLLVQKHGLNERQAAALGRILDFDSLTVRELEEKFPNVNRRTLQRDMRGLVEIGLVSSEGATNKLYYRFKEKTL